MNLFERRVIFEILFLDETFYIIYFIVNRYREGEKERESFTYNF